MVTVTRCCCRLHIREWSLSQDRLRDDGRKGKHGKTSVLQLPQLHPVDLILAFIGKESERIESEISGLASAALKHL